MKILRPCLVLTATLLILCSVLYPALVTAGAQALFPRQAKGSLIERDGKIRGSELIGQSFERPTDHPEYLWGRPSAASVDAATGVVVSGGSNLGPLSKALVDGVEARVAALRATGVTGPIPIDLVTTSGSGLDPHVSVAAAAIQIPRVARARGMTEQEVRGIIDAHTEAPTLGFLGQARVNVLAVNLDLDRRRPVAKVASPEAQ